MASNYSNYFFSVRSNFYAYDEYVYGLNSYTGSTVMKGANDPWSPVTGSTTVVAGNVVFDNYVFSPRSYGSFRDLLYSPPMRHYYTDPAFPPLDRPEADPAVKVNEWTVTTATTASFNKDSYSRISTRYRDREST
jgi:hypothetical protein